MFANLALAGVAVVEPLEEAVLVHELDAAAASARVPERVLVVPRVPADRHRHSLLSSSLSLSRTTALFRRCGSRLRSSLPLLLGSALFDRSRVWSSVGGLLLLFRAIDRRRVLRV